MADPENIQVFNRHVAEIFRRLYEGHPLPMPVSWADLTGDQSTPDAPPSHKAAMYAARWLEAEGYIRGPVDGHKLVGVLTSRAFAVLGTPSALKESGGAWYDELREGLAGTARDAALGHIVPRLLQALAG